MDAARYQRRKHPSYSLCWELPAFVLSGQSEPKQTKTSAQGKCQSCIWPSELLTSQAVQGTWICTGRSGVNRLNYYCWKKFYNMETGLKNKTEVASIIYDIEDFFPYTLRNRWTFFGNRKDLMKTSLICSLYIDAGFFTATLSNASTETHSLVLGISN